MYKTSKVDRTFSIKQPQMAFAIGMCKMKPKSKGKNRDNQKKHKKNTRFVDVPVSPSTPLLTGVYAIPVPLPLPVVLPLLAPSFLFVVLPLAPRLAWLRCG